METEMRLFIKILKNSKELTSKIIKLISNYDRFLLEQNVNEISILGKAISKRRPNFIQSIFNFI